MIEDILIPRGPQRIARLTEETTQWLSLPGEDARAVGTFGSIVRPARARQASAAS